MKTEAEDQKGKKSKSVHCADCYCHLLSMENKRGGVANVGSVIW